MHKDTNPAARMDKRLLLYTALCLIVVVVPNVSVGCIRCNVQTARLGALFSKQEVAAIVTAGRLFPSLESL